MKLTVNFRVETVSGVRPHMIFFDGVMEADSKESLRAKMRCMYDAIPDKQKYNIYFFDVTVSEKEYDLFEFGLLEQDGDGNIAPKPHDKFVVEAAKVDEAKAKAAATGVPVVTETQQIRGKDGKVLKLWNGRHWKADGHLYVAASSRRRVVELVRKAAGFDNACTEHEVEKYWHKGAWGNMMRDVTPEEGVWETIGGSYCVKPKRLI